MKFEFLFIGKTTDKFLLPGLEHYQGKLAHYMNCVYTIIPSSTEKNQTRALQAEAEKILKAVTDQDFLIVLDERGKELTTLALSREIQKVMNQSRSRIVFVTGSAYGMDDRLKRRANLLLSFSKFTFTHQMIRVVLLEQVYRAMTVLKGESYHHG